MRFGIHSNRNRDIGLKVACRLSEIIVNLGSTPVFNVELKDSILASVNGVEFGSFDSCDVIVSIGGDGTFLGVVSDYRDLNIPFFGINKGSIGFLTQCSEDDMEDGIKRIVANDYKLIERIQLDAELYDSNGNFKGSDICLNDVCVLRGEKPHILKLTLYVDGEHVEKFYGDGLVVATPTGSTAYTLAAGGPLLMPGMDNILITPLCSHTLQNASYVIGPESVVEIHMGDFETVPIICPDGHDFVKLEPNDVLKIKKHPCAVRTIDLGLVGFFQNVKRKIVARGSFYENG